MFLDDFGRRGELGIAEASLPEEIRQEGNAALPLNRLDGVARLDNEHVAVAIGVVRFTGADLCESPLDEIAYLRIGDACCLVGTTKDEHDGTPCGVACF